MKNLYLALAIFAGICLLSSCSLSPCGSKSSFIQDHTQFVQHIVDEGKSLDETDWEVKDEKFKQLVEECYIEHKADFTEAEKRAFWERNAQYYVKRTSHTVNIAEISNEIKDFLNNDLKVSIKEIETEIKEIFDEDLKEDLRETTEVIKEGIKEISRELKQIFKEESK